MCITILLNFILIIQFYNTGSPAGLRCVNGVRRSSARTWNFNPSPKSQFISIDFKFGVGDYIREVIRSNKVGLGPMSGRAATLGQQNTGPSCDFCLFLFFNRATAHTREPIFAQNSSKDADWCKEDPFGDEKCVVVKYGGVLPLKHPKNGPEWPITSQNKMSKTLKR